VDPHGVDEDFGVSVHVLVPLHTELVQAVDVQVIVVPLQLPPKQASLYVHALLSLQDTAVRHSQVPPTLVQ
jgi:hypothetical protein